MAYVLLALALLFIYAGARKFGPVPEGSKKPPVPPRMLGTMQLGIGAALLAWAASIFFSR